MSNSNRSIVQNAGLVVLFYLCLCCFTQNFAQESRADSSKAVVVYYSDFRIDGVAIETGSTKKVILHRTLHLMDTLMVEPGYQHFRSGMPHKGTTLTSGEISIGKAIPAGYGGTYQTIRFIKQKEMLYLFQNPVFVEKLKQFGISDINQLTK